MPIVCLSMSARVVQGVRLKIACVQRRGFESHLMHVLHSTFCNLTVSYFELNQQLVVDDGRPDCALRRAD